MGKGRIASGDILSPPPFEAGSLTSLKRLDRLVHEHQSLADIHHLKLELQIHATMAIFFFFQMWLL